MQRRQLEALSNPLEREAARRNLVEYVNRCAGLTSPIGEHQIEWADDLQRVAEGDLKRLLILAPRGHGKSTWVSEQFPAWMIGRNPDTRVLLVGPSGRVARAARRVRAIIQTKAAYREIFGALSPLKDGSRREGAAPKWAETEFTVRRSAELTEPTVAAVGAGAVIPGHRADLIVVDDAVCDKTITDSQREKLWDWFREAVLPVLEADAAIVVIGTRWHYADLYERLIDSREWTVIEQQAILEESSGQVLWPEKYSLEKLQQRRAEMGEVLFAIQYQNDPSGLKGQLLKKEWLRWFERGEDPARKHVTIIFGVDPAIGTDKSNDLFALAVLGITGDGFMWVYEIATGHFDFNQQVNLIRQKAAQWNPYKVAIESNAYQEALVHQLRAVSGLPLVASPATRDKVTRITALGPHFESRIKVCRSIEGLEEEYLQFPRGKTDDRLDALAIAVGAALEVLERANEIRAQQEVTLDIPPGLVWKLTKRGVPLERLSLQQWQKLVRDWNRHHDGMSF